MQVSLLVRNKEDSSLLVNFDPSITQILREIDCMLKMELQVPEAAKAIYQRQDQLKEHQHKLRVSDNRVATFLYSFIYNPG